MSEATSDFTAQERQQGLAQPSVQRWVTQSCHLPPDGSQPCTAHTTPSLQAAGAALRSGPMHLSCASLGHSVEEGGWHTERGKGTRVFMTSGLRGQA